MHQLFCFSRDLKSNARGGVKMRHFRAKSHLDTLGVGVDQGMNNSVWIKINCKSSYISPSPLGCISCSAGSRTVLRGRSCTRARPPSCGSRGSRRTGAEIMEEHVSKLTVFQQP